MVCHRDWGRIISKFRMLHIQRFIKYPAISKSHVHVIRNNVPFGFEASRQRIGVAWHILFSDQFPFDLRYSTLIKSVYIFRRNSQTKSFLQLSHVAPFGSQVPSTFWKFAIVSQPRTGPALWLDPIAFELPAATWYAAYRFFRALARCCRRTSSLVHLLGFTAAGLCRSSSSIRGIVMILRHWKVSIRVEEGKVQYFERRRAHG